MYSVCKPTVQKLPNQSQVMLSLPLYLQSIHNKEFDRKLLHLHTVAVRMFITNSLDKWISAYFFLSFTCCEIIFLYLK